MHMDEQDFQAYIDASNDLFEDSHEDEEEYLTRCVVDIALVNSIFILVLVMNVSLTVKVLISS